MYFSFLNKSIIYRIREYEMFKENIKQSFRASVSYLQRGGYMRYYILDKFYLNNPIDQDVMYFLQNDVYSLYFAFNIYRFSLDSTKRLSVYNNFLFSSNSIYKYKSNISNVKINVDNHRISKRGGIYLSKNFINLHKIINLSSEDGETVFKVIQDHNVIRRLNESIYRDISYDIKKLVEKMINILELFVKDYSKKERIYFYKYNSNKQDNRKRLRKTLMLITQMTLFFHTMSIFISMRFYLVLRSGSDVDYKRIKSINILLSIAQSECFVQNFDGDIHTYSIKSDDINKVKNEILGSKFVVDRVYNKISIE